METHYNTRSGQIPIRKLQSPAQLPNRASEFFPIHRRSLNITYESVNNSVKLLEILPDNIEAEEHLFVKDLSRDDLLLVEHREDILSKLSDNEKTLALYLCKVIQNDPLTTGVRESLTDSLVNLILTDMRFNKYPFILNLQPYYCFQVLGNKVSAKPEFSIEKNRSVLCFDEDKHFHSISSTTEYGESQIAAEVLACAFTNFDRPDSSTQGRGQEIFAIRVIGTRFTFYKCAVSEEYCRSLNEGFPTDQLTIYKYPMPERDTVYGYDYANKEHRREIVNLLLRLREHIRKM